MSITLARAVFKYQSEISGDLNFRIDDVIEVVRWEDENWIHGKIGNVQGIFPSNYVEILKLPSFDSSSECLLLATKSFQKEEDQDLAIKSGDLVVGVRRIDDNWWYGRCSGCEGIVPVTHVRWVAGSSGEVTQSEPQPKPFKKTDIPKPVRALASSDLKGQIDGELSFNAGDQVEIVRVVDDVFCEGICHGDFGIFPVHVVRILEPESFTALQNWCKEMNATYKKTSSLTHHNKPKNGERKERTISVRSRTGTGNRSFTSETTSTPDVQVDAYGKAIASFVGENSDELTFVAGDLVKLICHLDSDWTFGELIDNDEHSRRGIFPTRFVDIIVDCPYDERGSAGSSPAYSDNKKVEGCIYGVAKYNFYGDRSDDLHISMGDRVKLIRWVDENWCEAEDDAGNVGQCPTSYIDIQAEGSSGETQSGGQYDDTESQSPSEHTSPPSTSTQGQSADEKREKFSFASCTNLSLDEAIANEMNRAKTFSDKTQTISGIPLRKYQSITKQRPLSYQETSSIKINEDPKPVLRKKPAPPRPLMPEAIVPTIKPVPRRPVPPRPVPNAPDAAGEENATVVADLQKRIVSIEGNIKELEASENAASNIPEAIESGDTNDESIEGSLNSLRQDLRFYQDKLNKVTGNPSEEESLDEMRKKRAVQRANVMKELLSTEESYLRDLEVVYEAFVVSNSLKHTVDVAMLFGNLQEVITLSRRFLDTLRQTYANDESIGNVFLSYREEMVQVYVEYCKNHEDAVKYLVRGDTQLNNYVLDGLYRLSVQYNVFTTNLDALIIKPVQRVLKYPLLLNELLRSTEESNSDHAAIAEAVYSMTEAVKEINELKRRKDLVQKYLRPQPMESSSSISLAHGMHSLKKKGARLSQRLSSTFGFKSRTIDEEFNREEGRFRNCEKCIKVFLRDVQSHCDALKESINLHTSLSSDLFDFCSDSVSPTESESRTFLDAYIRAMDSFKNVYTIRIESRVLTPLYKLLSLFQGPNKIIKKRYDKLLDYDNMTHTVKKAKDSGQCSRMMQESLNQAEKTYEAMNNQLKDDLPVLNQLSSRLLHECIGNFVQIATQLADNMLVEIRPVLQNSAILSEHNLGFRDIMEAFNTQYAVLIDLMAKFTFVPKNFKNEPTSRFMVDETTTPQQTTEGRRAVAAQYPSDSQFVVLQNATATDGDPNGLGLAVREGDLVGVIKKAHPMGIAGRWFVDNGSNKGFVTSSILNLYSLPPPYSPVNAAMDRDTRCSPTTVWYVNLDKGVFTSAGSKNGLNLSAHSEPSTSTEPSSSVSYYEEIDDIPPTHDDISDLQTSTTPIAKSPPVQKATPVEWYRALYTFEARNVNEVSLVSGQMIQVIQRQDYSGNKEWWLVQVDKKQGYVPSYYIQPS